MSGNSGKSVLIAIPTNDGISIFRKMFGMAKYFNIYKTEDKKQFILNDKRSNPHEITMQHLKTLDVYAVIKDCGIIISAHIGKKGIERLKDKGVELIFRKGSIQEALNSTFQE
jgi:predicted Fe-Mo cluster-binding NifX family protein